jgi:hypothetical protein
LRTSNLGCVCTFLKASIFATLKRLCAAGSEQFRMEMLNKLFKDIGERINFSVKLVTVLETFVTLRLICDYKNTHRNKTKYNVAHEEFYNKILPRLYIIYPILKQGKTAITVHSKEKDKKFV